MQPVPSICSQYVCVCIHAYCIYIYIYIYIYVCITILYILLVYIYIYVYICIYIYAYIYMYIYICIYIYVYFFCLPCKEIHVPSRVEVRPKFGKRQPYLEGETQREREILVSHYSSELLVLHKCCRTLSSFIGFSNLPPHWPLPMCCKSLCHSQGPGMNSICCMAYLDMLHTAYHLAVCL